MNFFKKRSEDIRLGGDQAEPTTGLKYPEDAILPELHAETKAGMPKRRAWMIKMGLLSESETSDAQKGVTSTPPEPVKREPIKQPRRPAYAALVIPRGVSHKDFLLFQDSHPDATQQELEDYFAHR